MSKEDLYLKGLLLDVRDYVEKKGKFDYLKWSYCWSQVKLLYPDATFTIKTFVDWEKVLELAEALTPEVQKQMVEDDQLPVVPYLKKPLGSWVNVCLFLGAGHDPQDHWFPILDHNNKPVANPSSFDVNAALMRGLVKVCAMHTGVGLYIYSGEKEPSSMESGSPVASDDAIQALKAALQEPAMQEFITDENHKSYGKTREAALLAYCESQNWSKESVKAAHESALQKIAEWTEAKARLEKELTGLKAEVVGSAEAK